MRRSDKGGENNRRWSERKSLWLEDKVSSFPNRLPKPRPERPEDGCWASGHKIQKTPHDTPTKKQKTKNSSRLTLSLAELTGRRSSEGFTENKLFVLNKIHFCGAEMYLRPTAAAGLWPSDGTITCWEMWARPLNASLSSLSRRKLKYCCVLGGKPWPDPGLLGLSQSQAGVSAATRYCVSMLENQRWKSSNCAANYNK